MQKAYLLKKKAKNAPKLKNYFEDSDEDDSAPQLSMSAPQAVADDYDPLDAFMAKNDEQIAKDNTIISTVENLPEIVSEVDVDYESSIVKEVRVHHAKLFPVLIISWIGRLSIIRIWLRRDPCGHAQGW